VQQVCRAADRAVGVGSDIVPFVSTVDFASAGWPVSFEFMGTPSQSDAELMQSALTAAQKLALQMKVTKDDLADDRWAEGAIRVDRVGQSAQAIIEQLTSLQSDQT